MLFNLFTSKKHKELDAIISRLYANMSNNYKDNAQDNLKELCKLYEELKSSGKLNDKQTAIYGNLIENLQHEMEGYTHKDQKPYWT